MIMLALLERAMNGSSIAALGLSQLNLNAQLLLLAVVQPPLRFHAEQPLGLYSQVGLQA